MPQTTVDLPKGGFARVDGHQGEEAPLLLLHGLGCTSARNWAEAQPVLAERTKVVSVDHRGHGHGKRCGRRFRLADCADDAAEVLRATVDRPAIVVGYSMGGPIAQLLARRHPELVAGLVFTATARDFRGAPSDRVLFAALAAGAATIGRFGIPGLGRIDPSVDVTGALHELRQHQVGAVLGAGAALGRFTSRAWVGLLDVPSAVVVHEHDELVPARRQRKLAESLCDVTSAEIDAGHMAPWEQPELWIGALQDAVASVERRVADDRRIADRCAVARRDVRGAA